MSGVTLSDVLAANQTLYVNCGHPACMNSKKIDVRALADQLGESHGAMHVDLKHLFRCSRCEERGLDRRPVFFTLIQDYEADMRSRNQERWPDRPGSRAG